MLMRYQSQQVFIEDDSYSHLIGILKEKDCKFFSRNSFADVVKWILQKIGTFEREEYYVKVGQDIDEHCVEVQDYGSPWVELHLDVSFFLPPIL